MFQPEDSFPNTHNHKRKKGSLTYNHMIIEAYYLVTLFIQLRVYKAYTKKNDHD